MAHRNIPVFVPHMGCPHQCVFCNQHSISGCQHFSMEEVDKEIQTALATMAPADQVEIAFFGGSFTGIERSLMIALLDKAQAYVESGQVSSIRLSTRPDYIDDEILSILSRYAVETVELGLQSFSDAVLAASHRGHSAKDAERACRLVIKAGFSLVGQMMIGLPSSTPMDEEMTARKIVSLGAAAVRIYPTVVFKDTPLYQMYREGRYTALSPADAIVRSERVLRIFLDAEVACIRLGLCATESLTDPATAMAGPNHPALGELVWNEYYYRELLHLTEMQTLTGQRVILILPPHLVSKVVGQKRSNIKRLFSETGTTVEKIIQDKSVRHISVLPYPT